MKIYLVCFFSLLASCTMQAQQTWSKPQLAVQQTIVNLFDALSKRDPAALQSYCTADVSFFEYGQIWNIDTLIAKAITNNTAAEFKRTNTFDFISTRADKNTAYLIYHLTSVIFREGKQTTVQWVETVLLEKEKRQWKVKHLHSTLINRK